MSQPDDDSSIKRYGSSESESKPSGSSSQPRKRASRAGTRSVSNLSAAQLERKRANDREAQRAIRQRTKDHIESLERKVAEFTGIQEQRERVLAANQARVRELEQENAYLRTRMGNDAFLMQLPNNQCMFFLSQACSTCDSTCAQVLKQLTVYAQPNQPTLL